MPAYKDKERGTWYVNFYYTDWQGIKRQKRKRGFKREKDAKEWERNFLESLSKTSDITFSILAENYLSDIKTRLKPTTCETKENILTTKILPYFKDFKVCDIDEIAVRNWQNTLLQLKQKNGKELSSTYLRTISAQLSAILNYATTYYKLQYNPIRKTGHIGKPKAKPMSIWTLEQFEHFITYETKPAAHLAFNILYWTGIREGELLALTRSDFTYDESKNEYRININKNFAVVKQKQYILTPKTESSERNFAIPEFLYKEVISYYESLYHVKPNERLFYFVNNFLLQELKCVAIDAGLKPIRVHDLRHSHASLLIEMGYNILMVSNRLGHEKVETTWQIYAHLYPNKDALVATTLNAIKLIRPSDTQLTDFINSFSADEYQVIDISTENIIRFELDTKTYTTLTYNFFLQEVQNLDIEIPLITSQLYQSGYIELDSLLYCLSSRSFPAKYLL